MGWVLFAFALSRVLANVCVVIPFGRVTSLRADVADAGREGGKAEQFWEWSDDQVRAYL